jgi:RNA polymerase sigma-70 factor (sigma-E family)
VLGLAPGSQPISSSADVTICAAMQPFEPRPCPRCNVIDGRPDADTSAEVLQTAFEAHYDGLVRLATLLSGRQDVAEDLVQEAFVRSVHKLSALPEQAVGSYLRSTVVNLWKNRIRRLVAERRQRIEPAAPEHAATLETHDELWRAVSRLPRRQRACLVLRYYEDLSERETAYVLGCSVGTVKSQTSRALRRLREEVGDDDR